MAGCLLASMPIMAKAEAANKKQMKLLTTFSLRLVTVPRVRLRDVFDMERRALDGAGTAEKVELVVGDSFEKRGRSSWRGACSVFIGDSAKNFVHGQMVMGSKSPPVVLVLLMYQRRNMAASVPSSNLFSLQRPAPYACGIVTCSNQTDLSVRLVQRTGKSLCATQRVP